MGRKPIGGRIKTECYIMMHPRMPEVHAVGAEIVMSTSQLGPWSNRFQLRVALGLPLFCSDLRIAFFSAPRWLCYLDDAEYFHLRVN